MENELKKCPFCGRNKAKSDNSTNGYLIKCNFCKCNTGSYPTLMQAVKAWNTRTEF